MTSLLPPAHGLPADAAAPTDPAADTAGTGVPASPSEGHPADPVGPLSPMLAEHGAVAAEGADSAVSEHYGDPFREQRDLARGQGVVDLSHFGVVAVTGPERAKLLHALSTQDLRSLPAGGTAELAVLDHNGHVEHHAWLLEDGTTAWLVTDTGRAAPLAAFLDAMVFMLDAAVADAGADRAPVWVTGPVDATAPTTATAPTASSASAAPAPVAPDPVVTTPDGAFLLVPRAELADRISALRDGGRRLAGLGAWNALRVAGGRVRPADIDHRTIPNELGWIGTAVSLDKGCYRGQETVARVHTLGRPPRRLTVLSLDGSDSVLPHPGDPILLLVPAAAVHVEPGSAAPAAEVVVVPPVERVVGTVTSAVRHFEAGPLALALVKRSIPVAATLHVRVGDGGTVLVVPALQEPVVDPDVGLHVRPQLR